MLPVRRIASSGNLVPARNIPPAQTRLSPRRCFAFPYPSTPSHALPALSAQTPRDAAPHDTPRALQSAERTSPTPPWRMYPSHVTSSLPTARQLLTSVGNLDGLAGYRSQALKVRRLSSLDTDRTYHRRRAAQHREAPESSFSTLR